MRFSFRQAKDCLGEDRISPCKPTSYSVISIDLKKTVLDKTLQLTGEVMNTVNVNAFMNKAEPTGIPHSS